MMVFYRLSRDLRLWGSCPAEGAPTYQVLPKLQIDREFFIDRTTELKPPATSSLGAGAGYG